MPKPDFDIISVDIEAGGVGKPLAVLSPDGQPYPLLSIGCVRLSDFSTFYAEIGYENMTVTPESMQIHGLNVANMNTKPTKLRKDTLPNAKRVDLRLVEWLKSDKYYKEGKKYCLLPMGMNVGSFDMQFVHYWLPKSGELFGYRSIDLNALTFLEAWQTDEATFDKIKDAAKTIGHSFALAHMGQKLAHHALYDAWTNIGYFNYLIDAEKSPMTVGQVTWGGGKPE